MNSILNTINSNTLNIVIGFATIANTVEFVWPFWQFLQIQLNRKLIKKIEQKEMDISSLFPQNTDARQKLFLMFTLLNTIDNSAANMTLARKVKLLRIKIIEGKFNMLIGQEELVEGDIVPQQKKLIRLVESITKDPEPTILGEFISTNLMQQPQQTDVILCTVLASCLYLGHAISLITAYSYGLSNTMTISNQPLFLATFCTIIYVKQWDGDTSPVFAPIYQGLDDLVARIINTTRDLFRHVDLALG